MKRELTTLILMTLASPLAAQWLTLPTPDIPRTKDGAPDLSAPTPRTSAGHPDLSGLWRPSKIQSELRDAGNLQPWVRTLYDEREKRFFADGPRYSCLPVGPENLSNTSNSYGLRQILQHPSMVAMHFNDGSYRQIFTDGRELEPNPLPTWMGYSVGHWDGDTLVVESNGYNNNTWLGRGISHTDQLRMTERYSRSRLGNIQVEITYDDPGALEETLHAPIEMTLAADEQMLETVCTEAYGGERGNWIQEVSSVEETEMDVALETLERYVGTYAGMYLTNYITMNVTLVDGELYLQKNNATPARLSPQSDTAFLLGGLGFVFTVNDEGVATTISEVHVSGASE